MDEMNIICVWIAELISFFAALASFVYGLKHFFKKGKALYLQSITMAMGCYALSCVYQICHMLTGELHYEGFTPAYFGRIGFFLFLVAASYGQMDRIVDDGSKPLRPARYIALIAPILSAALFILNCTVATSHVSVKIAYGVVWIPASISLYYSLKHAIIPDLDFGFVKAIKPYSIFAFCLGFTELLSMTAKNYRNDFFTLLLSTVFSVLCVATILVVKRGVKKWTI